MSWTIQTERNILQCCQGFNYNSMNPPSFGYEIKADWIKALEPVDDAPFGICTMVYLKSGHRFYSIASIEQIKIHLIKN